MGDATGSAASKDPQALSWIAAQLACPKYSVRSAGGVSYSPPDHMQPELLINIGGAQGLGPYLFMPELSIPKCRLQLHRTTQEVCVVDCVRFYPFCVCLRIFQSIFTEIQVRQVRMNPKQPGVLVERGCDFECYLKMINNLLCLAFGVIHTAKGSVTLAGQKLFALV